MAHLKNLTNNLVYFKEYIKRILSYIKPLKYAYDFDYISILIVELHQLKRVRKALERNGYYNHYHINTAINILQIIVNDNYMFVYDKYINKNNAKWYYYSPSSWRYAAYTTNRTMFSDKYWKEVVYECKCWHIYCNMKENYLKHWWI